MRRFSYRLWKETVIFYLGGMLYCGIELLWRGQTHWSMFLLGAVCFCVVGGLDRFWRAPVLAQMAVGALLITALEFLTGLLVNRALGMHVWSYAGVPLNLMGEICLPFTLLWFPLCGAAIFVEDALRLVLFREPFPRIRWVL